MNLTDLQTFSVVAQTGSISAAARRLGVPKSTVSRRVRRLEDERGVELLHRSPRAVSLTASGRVLHERTAAAFETLDAAAAALDAARSEPEGTLRLTTVPGFGHSRRFVNCLLAFGLLYPNLRISVELTTRMVRLVDEGFDLGLRLHTRQLPSSASLMSRRLLRFGRALYASPAYVAERGLPTSLAELSSHRLAGHSIVDVRDHQWHRAGAPVDAPVPFPEARWLVNDAAALERLALSGAGVVLLSTLEGDPLVTEGRLVRVLPDHEQPGAAASLVWPASRYLAPRVRAFLDHAVATMGA